VDASVSLQIYVRGFARAHTRFDEAGHDWERGFHAVFETVTWSGSIRERLRALSGDCPELEGLWWVRNLVVHVGGDALTQTIVSHQASLANSISMVYRNIEAERALSDTPAWQWRRRHEIPRHPQSPVGTDEYDTHLAGKAVAQTFAAVADFLDAN
jgi:hypothetical protein